MFKGFVLTALLISSAFAAHAQPDQKITLSLEEIGEAKQLLKSDQVRVSERTREIAQIVLCVKYSNTVPRLWPIEKGLCGDVLISNDVRVELEDLLANASFDDVLRDLNNHSERARQAVQEYGDITGDGF